MKFTTADQVEVDLWILDDGETLAHQRMLLRRTGPKTFNTPEALEVPIIRSGYARQFAITVQGVVWSGGRVGPGCSVELGSYAMEPGWRLLFPSVNLTESNWDEVEVFEDPTIPEHNKLTGRKDEHEHIQAFLRYLEGECLAVTRLGDCYGIVRPEELVAGYFDVDPVALEQEKCVMLAALQEVDRHA